MLTVEEKEVLKKFTTLTLQAHSLRAQVNVIIKAHPELVESDPNVERKTKDSDGKYLNDYPDHRIAKTLQNYLGDIRRTL